MPKTSCFFTGHRSFLPKNDPAAAKNLMFIITALAEEGVTDFYAGGAYGWDAFCALSVIVLKKRFPDVKLHLILPCPPEQQTLKWSDEQKAEYNIIQGFADDVKIVSDNYTKDCMKKRNARLVELGDICICYYNENDFRSGTGQTVRMAQKANKTIFNLYTTIRST